MDDDLNDRFVRAGYDRALARKVAEELQRADMATLIARLVKDEQGSVERITERVVEQALAAFPADARARIVASTRADLEKLVNDG
ncbi:hypothetical protein PYCC9005_002267 [Savitreella phatthalungensis]